MASITGDSHPEEHLLIHRVDHLAKTTPHALFAEFPVSHDSYDEGIHKVTYGVLANAVNAVAWWLEATLGRGKDFETLAYIGPNDLRYTAFTLGAAKAGYLIFFVCPHNLAAAQVNLFRLLECRTVITGKSNICLADVALDTVKPRVVEAPSVADLLRKRHPLYPFDRTFEQARTEPLVALHTSGSAGLPKPIVWTHDFASAYIRQANLEPPPGFESQASIFQRQRVFLTFPPYNGAYIVNHLFNAIPNGTVIISTPDTNVPTTNSFIQGLRATTADVAFLAPSIVVTLAREPRRLEFVRHRVKLLMYCGGTIPEALGNVVASKLRLVDQYGASEIGLAAAIRHRSDGTNGHSNCNDLEAFDDAAWSYERQSGNRVHAYYTPAKIARPDRLALGNWNYVRFHPSIGSQMRHYMGDMYELVIARNTSGPSSPCSPFGPGFITTKHTDVNEPHPDYFNVAPAGKRQAPNEDSQAPLQPAFAFFPHALEYHTRDLWSPHPTKPGLWLLRARVDDLFTLSTGQIINPVPYEHGVLAASQDVEGVLLFGHGRSQPGLLIELRDGNDDEADPSDDGNGNGVPSGDHITTKLANSTDRLHSEAKPAHRHENLAARRRLGDTDGMSDVQRTPTPTPTETYERLWSAVQTVNGLFPPHMRVNRELLILADPASPMHRAGKGTTQRQLTLGRYQEDIERAYADAERGGGGGGTGGDG